jgi:small multidrug resistance family-3 protein
LSIAVITKSLALFFLAGLLEIGGGYLVWLWLREERGWLVGALEDLFCSSTESFLPFSRRTSVVSTQLTEESSWFCLSYGAGKLTERHPTART